MDDGSDLMKRDIAFLQQSNEERQGDIEHVGGLLRRQFRMNRMMDRVLSACPVLGGNASKIGRIHAKTT